MERSRCIWLLIAVVCVTVSSQAGASIFRDNFNGYADGILDGQPGPNGGEWIHYPGSWSTGMLAGAACARGGSGKGIGDKRTHGGVWNTALVPLGETIASGTYVFKVDLYHQYAVGGHSYTEAGLSDADGGTLLVGWDDGKVYLNGLGFDPSSNGQSTGYDGGWLHAEMTINFTTKSVSVTWSNPDGSQNGTFNASYSAYGGTFSPDYVSAYVLPNPSGYRGMDNIAIVASGEPDMDVYVVDPPITNSHALTTEPLPAAFSNTIQEMKIAACRGEYEPASFVVTTNQTLQDVEIEIGQLTGSAGTLPASSVKVQLVKRLASSFAHPERAPMLDVLVNDPDLFTVEWDSQAERYENIFCYPMTDAASILPVDITDLQQFWVTVHIPTDTVPGVYHAPVSIIPTNAATKQLTLEVTVRPTTLLTSAQGYSIWKPGIVSYPGIDSSGTFNASYSGYGGVFAPDYVGALVLPYNGCARGVDNLSVSSGGTTIFATDFDSCTDGDLDGQSAPNGGTWNHVGTWSTSIQVDKAYAREHPGKGVGDNVNPSGIWRAGLAQLGQTLTSGTYTTSFDLYHGAAGQGVYSEAGLWDADGGALMVGWYDGRVHLDGLGFDVNNSGQSTGYDVGWLHVDLNINFNTKAIAVSWYNPGYGRDVVWGVGSSGPLLSESQYLLEAQNCLAHGVTSPNMYEPLPLLPGGSIDFSYVEDALSIYEQAGMPVGRPMHLLGHPLQIEYRDLTSQERTTMINQTSSIVSWATSLGYPNVYLLTGDELTDNQITGHRSSLQAIHDGGGKCFESIMQASSLQLVDDLMDRPVLMSKAHVSLDNLFNTTPDEEVLEAASLSAFEDAGRYTRDLDTAHQAAISDSHGYGHKVYAYMSPLAAVPFPEMHRRNQGLGLWKSNLDGSMNWSYSHINNNSYHFSYVYRLDDGGVIDSLAWEGFREGADDNRYLATLNSALAGASGVLGGHPLISATQSWLSGLDVPNDSLNIIRKEMAWRAEALMGYGTLTGTVTLDGYTGDRSITPIGIELIPIDGQGWAETRRVFLDGSNCYSISVIPGVYRVAFTGCKFLRSMKTGTDLHGVRVSHGASTTCNVTLLNGDVDGDDYVGQSDQDALDLHYSQSGD